MTGGDVVSEALSLHCQVEKDSSPLRYSWGRISGGPFPATVTQGKHVLCWLGDATARLMRPQVYMFLVTHISPHPEKTLSSQSYWWLRRWACSHCPLILITSPKSDICTIITFVIIRISIHFTRYVYIVAINLPPLEAGSSWDFCLVKERSSRLGCFYLSSWRLLWNDTQAFHIFRVLRCTRPSLVCVCFRHCDWRAKNQQPLSELGGPLPQRGRPRRRGGTLPDCLESKQI